MATIYMKVDGVDGRVTTKGYEKHIELDSCQAGTSCPTQAKAGNMADISGGTISFSDIPVSRGQDISTVELYQKMFDKKPLKKVEFKFLSQGDQPTEYLTITIENAWITNYSLSAHGGSGDRPSEMISFSYSKISYQVKAYNVKGAVSDTKTVAYDLATLKKA